MSEISTYNQTMSSYDQAKFDQWYEQFATDEERELPYDKQIEAHLLWLCGLNGWELEYIEFAPEEKEQPN